MDTVHIQTPGGSAEEIVDLAQVPSFPAVYTAALSPGRPRRRGRPVLPDTVLRVRGVHLDAARARDFDHLMGGPATDLVHPGVLHVVAFPVALSLMARRSFPFRLLGVVHLRNQLLQHRPVRVGETVDVQCRVRALAEHRKGWTFEAVATLHGQDGEIIATDVSTYLAPEDVEHTGTGGKTGEKKSSGSRRREFTPPEPTGRWRLPADTGRRYAAVSGDANPIHLSALSAKAFGFPRAIAHGMYTASRALTESRPDLTTPLRWDVSFDAPVTLPGTVLVAYEDTPAAAGRATRCVGWRPGRDGKPPRRCFEVEVTALG